ncbi:MAG: WYL domain-containing protein, partial [Erysipelothrix sp.]|nr:WYL domain-containing protein [Erysipelothrix sp.]
YLVCRFEDYDDLAFYRIDYMKKVEILPKESKPLDAKFDPYSYVRSHTYMFNGHVEKVKIKCSNTILGYVIEDFGKDIHLEKGDDDHFIATLRSSERGILFWLGRYMNYCEILEPQAYRDKFIESLKSTLLKYE